MALSGLSQEQRKFYGVFPLRGKLLNVKDSSVRKVEQTEEVANLKKILGLESGKKYNDIKSLRYGKILIMTDQDYDGSHIRGLLINMFHELWHELIQVPNFITYMATPIVKATKGSNVKSFYTQYDYEEWRKTDASKGWKVKYYKGLISLRKAHPAFRMATTDLVRKNLKFLTSPEGTIAYSLNGSAVKDSAATLVVIHNANTSPQTITLPKSGTWSVLVESAVAGTSVLRKITGGSVVVEARSTLVITQ
jgi:5S rRNA maturation endonuclease (ribonuclease M5)